MSEFEQIRTSVVVVGGGPVGGLAATLGKAGIQTVVVERSHEPSAIPKGQNLTARSLEHFYFWDCADQLRAARLLPPGFPIGGITAYESLAGQYWYAPAGRETVGAATPIPNRVRAAQPGRHAGLRGRDVRLVGG